MPTEVLKLDAEHSDILNDISHTINLWATSKGWNDTPDSIEHKASQIALMHSELSECLEFIRKKVYECPDHGRFQERRTDVTGQSLCPVCLQELHAMDDHVPSLTGEAAELADVLIRIFHYCGKRNINLGEAVRL